MKIVRFGQMMDLNRGDFVNSFEVELDDGRVESISTNEETLQQLIQLMVGGQKAVGAERNREHFAKYLDSEEPADIFGGDVSEASGEVVVDDVPLMGTIAEEYATPEPPPEPKPRPAPRPNVDADGFLVPVRPRTVDKDEMGYPVVNRLAPPSRDDGEDDGQQI